MIKPSRKNIFAIFVATAPLARVTANNCEDKRILTTTFCCDYEGGVLEMSVDEEPVYEWVFKDAYNDNIQKSGIDVKMIEVDVVKPEAASRNRNLQTARVASYTVGTTCHLCPFDDIPIADRRRRLETTSREFPEGRRMQATSFHATLEEYLRTNLTSFSALTTSFCDICPESVRAEDSAGIAIENKNERRLYAQNFEYGEEGVGARLHQNDPLYYPNQKWVFIEEECPPNSSIDAIDCYIIKNSHSNRRLYAEKDKDWSNGFGASSDVIIRDDEYWYLKEADCPGSAIQCQMIINAHSGRALYGMSDQDLSNGVGATAPSRESIVAGWRSHKWMIGIWRT